MASWTAVAEDLAAQAKADEKAGHRRTAAHKLSVGRQAWANSQDLWIGVPRDLLITTR